MFYFHEILKKRGKFGVIWLAATAPKRLSKRDAFTVDVVKRSNDVLDVLTHCHTSEERKNVRFSLYLSAQLMYGLASINRIQSDILFEDVKNLSGRIGCFRREISSSIDLQEPVSEFRVRFEEPDFENAPPDFGCLKAINTLSTALPSYEYFVVTTPRSSGSEEWIISPSVPEAYRAQSYDADEEHLAKPEKISLQEAPVLPLFEENVVEDIPDKTDFFEDFTLFITPRPPSEMSQTNIEIEPELHTEEAISRDQEMLYDQSILGFEVDVEQQQISHLRTPTMPIIVSEPISRRRPLAEIADTTLPLAPKPIKKPRKMLFTEEESSFILESIDYPSRRRRQRHLIIDQEITLSRSKMEQNIATSNKHLISFEVISIEESAQSMFTRFGSRAAMYGNKRFWRNLKTLSEPNDPSKFGHFLDTKVSESTIATDTAIPSAVDISVSDVIEEFRGESVEETRAEILGHSDETSVTASKTLHISRTFQDTHEQTLPTKVSSLIVPDVPDLPRTEVPEMVRSFDIPSKTTAIEEPQDIVEEIPEPEVPINEIERFQVELEKSGVNIRKSKICVVSPEKTPPPSSPMKPSSPLLDQAMAYIKEAFEESPVAGLITFTSVIRKSPATRKYVAKLFHFLLSLHGSSVIHIEQPVPDGEIFISKGPNFQAF